MFSYLLLLLYEPTPLVNDINNNLEWGKEYMTVLPLLSVDSMMIS